MIDGTGTLLYHQADGYCWAALFNTLNLAGTDPITALSGGTNVFNAIAAVAQWPTNDLFDSDADGLPDSWELAHFGSLSASNGTEDHDGDGLSDAAEWVAMSSPIDSADNPRLGLLLSGDGTPFLEVATHGGRVYSVHAISALGQDWETSTLVNHFNGDGFTRAVPIVPTGASVFYRLSVELRAKPLKPDAYRSQ